MDYKEKYEQALERARKINSGIGIGVPDGTTVCEAIFPELAESEDEKIIEGIHNLVTQYGKSFDKLNGVPINSVFAWLEKQGQKPVIEMKIPEESLGISSEKYNKIVDECIYSEQKPVEWSEEDESMLNNVIDALITLSQTTHSGYEIGSMINWLKSLRPQSGTDNYNIGYNKGFRDGVKEEHNKQKQELSEEDKEHISRIIQELNNQKDRSINSPYEVIIDSDINWLKSLRPQNQWKPSEEQLGALRALAVTGIVSEPKDADLINSLYDDLNNLKAL